MSDFVFQGEGGNRDVRRSRGLGDGYKGQVPSVPSRFFSETALRIFLKFGMKFRLHKGSNVTRPDFLFLFSKRLKSPFLAKK